MNLDVGCGCMADVHMKRAGLGIDVNQGLADVVCDARFMPFQDKVFDSASCIEVLEHVKNSEAILSEVKRVTMKGSEITLVYPLKAFEQASWKANLNPLVAIDLVLSVGKLLKWRKLRGQLHRSEVAPELVSQYFRVVSNCTFFIPRKLHNLSRIFRRNITSGGWTAIRQVCSRDG